MSSTRRASTGLVLLTWATPIMALLLASPAVAQTPCEPQWAEGFSLPGLDDIAPAMAVFDDGSGPALYVGGYFTSADGAVVNHIAKWSGGTWSPLGSGMNSNVNALAVFDDGSGPALYAAGDFTTAGGVAANCIAKWDGGNWSPLGSGIGGTVWALAAFDDGNGPALYVGGWFTTAGGVAADCIAKWDGGNWSPLGSGLSGGSYTAAASMAVFDDGSGPALYVGGDFTTAGGVAANYVAKWNGSAWSPLGSGMTAGSPPPVYALTVFDDGSGSALYAGGTFTAAGGVAADNIAKWDGSTWSPVGGGVGGGSPPYIYTLTTFDDGSGPALYAGGYFATAGGAPANRVAKWDGNAWSPLGDGVNSLVLSLLPFDDGNGPALYAGGYFTSADGTPANGIAKWDGSSWSALANGSGQGLDDAALALSVFDDGSGPALYAGGYFTIPGGARALQVAKWNGDAWAPLGSGTGSGVRALTVFDDGNGPALYAGGNFTTAGGAPASCIAKWDGSTWSPLGSGLGGGSYPSIYALTVFDDGSGPALYAGGNFTTAGGAPANRIAKWDGTNWSPLGSGIDASSSRVEALTVFDDGNGPALYAGGLFTTAGGVTANGIAKWNGDTWSPVGNASTGTVSALTVFDDGNGPALYAGGTLYYAGFTRKHIAKWDGSAWSPLGSGMNSAVLALSVFDDGSGPALFAGGWFTTAGGVAARYIAKWNGSAWSALGSGVGGGSSPNVSALAVFDDGSGPALYAGGAFTLAGGMSSSRIAKWTGCAPPPAGDLDGDGDLDLDDFLTLTTCIAGPSVDVPTGCDSADLTGDGAVDLADYATWQVLLGTP